jgi:cholesterol transport system auxiliary component
MLGAMTLSCALANKADPMSPRFFTPTGVLEPEAPVRELSSVHELRLGQVDSAAHLEERIAYRVSDTELGYYEDRRWTEPPEQYLRRALSDELFEKRGLRRVVSGSAPTLDVELVSFEELRHGQPRARLGLRFSLRDDRRSLLERALVVERPLGEAKSGDGGPELAVAMARVLDQAVADLADQIIRQLEAAQAVARP